MRNAELRLKVSMWPYLEDDYMEYGDTGWVSIGEGWLEHQSSGHKMSPDGIEYDENGNIIEEDL